MNLKEIVEQLQVCDFQGEAGPLKNNVAFMTLERLARLETFFAEETHVMANALVRKIADTSAGDHCAIYRTDQGGLTEGLCLKCRTDIGLHPDLQPCPFCGERVNLRVDAYGVVCCKCYASGPARPLETSAVKRWNQHEPYQWIIPIMVAEIMNEMGRGE